MHGTIAVTDCDWYRRLSGRPELHEINFWKPSPRETVKLPELSPFLFKLKSPHNAICGFAFFARWSRLPVWLAWDTFGVANGCETLGEMRARIDEIRRRNHIIPEPGRDEIGCVLLVHPVFFPRDAWIRQPSDWKPNIVTSKGYDLTAGEGARVWAECAERAPIVNVLSGMASSSADEADGPRFGTPYLVRPRTGQGVFRVAVTDAYGRACSVTGEHSLPALDAAHIRPYADDGPHDVRNGLLLRADLHRLFDAGYVTVTPDLRLRVSPRLKSEFDNGRAYYPLDGQLLRKPASPQDAPDPELLRWHNEAKYVA